MLYSFAHYTYALGKINTLDITVHVWRMENGNQIPGRWNVKVWYHIIVKLHTCGHRSEKKLSRIPILTHTTHMSTGPVANCGHPLSPTNGLILPYTNTLEGTIVTYICWNIHQEENLSLCTEVNTTAVCNEYGNWKLISQDLCSMFSG